MVVASEGKPMKRYHTCPILTGGDHMIRVHSWGICNHRIAGQTVASVLRDCTFQQKLLISQLVKILDGDHLARLSVTAESRLLLWAHETLLKILDSDLLPVYLDILQVLKSKSPVLVEHMIHSSVTREGGEALGLLLKRPWSIVTGMEAVDRQVKFEPAPIFVVLPHASMGVGGRRWRLWHSQLSSIGKVYPVILPEHLTNPCQALNLQVLVEEMVTVSLTRVQEDMGVGGWAGYGCWRMGRIWVLEDGQIWVLEDGQDMGVGGWAGYGCWRMGRIWVLEDGQDMGVGGWAGYGCWRI
eukprot:Em0324g1a